jgi:hypothetical protein
MTTRTRKVDGQIERQIATGMIVSAEYLKAVRAIYADELIAAPFVAAVAKWCLDYHKQYERAPGRDIANIFESHKRNGLPDEQANLIEDFLAGLSDEYEHAEAGKFNAAYLLDRTEERFEARNQELLMQDITALHVKGDFKSAEELIRNYRRVERPSGTGVEPFTDKDAIYKAFDDEKVKPLLVLPGALGDLIGPIVRGDFVGLMGMEKIGKSWRLQDIAMRALRAGCNVAYFDAGDMDEDQIIVRLHTRNSKQSPKYWGRTKTPVLDCTHGQDDSCRKRERVSRYGIMIERRQKDGTLKWERMAYEEAPGHRPCTACVKAAPHDFKGAVWYEMIETEQLTWQRAVELGKRLAVHTRKRLKLSCHANSTLTVAGMDVVLDRWEEEDGFVPDLIIADYFDIFDAENPKTVDERHKQNDRWKAGRRLTQQRHCALIAATQADAASYDQKSLKLKNFSEAKTKYAHVTKFVFINQTPEEKRDMVVRMALALAREEDFDIRDEVVVMQNLRLGQPYLGSFRYRQ